MAVPDGLARRRKVGAVDFIFALVSITSAWATSVDAKLRSFYFEKSGALYNFGEIYRLPQYVAQMTQYRKCNRLAT